MQGIVVSGGTDEMLELEAEKRNGRRNAGSWKGKSIIDQRIAEAVAYQIYPQSCRLGELDIRRLGPGA